jgi:hypothetical protein
MPTIPHQRRPIADGPSPRRTHRYWDDAHRTWKTHGIAYLAPILSRCRHSQHHQGGDHHRRSAAMQPGQKRKPIPLSGIFDFCKLLGGIFGGRVVRECRSNRGAGIRAHTQWFLSLRTRGTFCEAPIAGDPRRAVRPFLVGGGHCSGSAADRLGSVRCRRNRAIQSWFS